MIECKAKRATEGTIGLNDAFSVIAKSSHLDPISMITLGKPAFDRLPIQRAASGGILLLTHVTLCEAVLRIWEGKLTPAALLNLLRRTGVLDRDDLDVGGQVM